MVRLLAGSRLVLLFDVGCLAFHLRIVALPRDDGQTTVCIIRVIALKRQQALRRMAVSE
jgi:hypothetical protein